MTGQSRDNGDPQRPPRALVCVLTFDNMLYFDRDEGIGLCCLKVCFVFVLLLSCVDTALLQRQFGAVTRIRTG